MEGEQRQTYQCLRRDTIKEDNVYELCQVLTPEERKAEQPVNVTQRKNKRPTWNKPLIVIVLLLSMMIILQIGILCLLMAHMSMRDTGSTSTNGIEVTSNVSAIAGNFNEWVAQNTLQSYPNFTELDEQILQSTRGSAQKLINIVNTLSNLQDTSTSTAGVVDDILLIAQQLLVLHNESTALPTSCKELKRQHQSLYSGYYILSSANGSTDYTAYCNMNELCGSREGWTRLAYLNMGYSTQNCPTGFRLYQSGYYRACGRPATNSAGCVSVQFPSNGISYSQICGRVRGYQYGTTDAMERPTYSYRNDINSYYVDGVSITRGSPRQHVWTLMSGLNEVSTLLSSCPCNNGSTVSVPSFIGKNYFCESGNPNSGTSHVLYTSDRLWDRYNCRSLESPCCNAPGLPWFHRDYGRNTTTDFIELRVCGDEETLSNEDSPVYYYEIYVK